MTDDPPALIAADRLRTARAAAVTTWAYAAGFGLPAVPVAIYLNQRGSLPTFMGLFPMYGGPWSAALSRKTMSVRLTAFLGVTVLAAATGAGLWKGSRRAAVANLALLPVEAVFWAGFALPLPVVTGLTRLALLARALRPPRSD